MIRIDLDTVRQDIQPSQGTYQTVSRARCVVPGSRTQLESAGNGDNIRKVCESLRKMGVTGQAMVFRWDTPVFQTPIDIERFADGKWGVVSND